MGKGQVGAEDLHRVLDAEVSKLGSGSDWARWLDAAALFPAYGFGNVVLINLQMPQASWVAHWRTWNKLGRRVNTTQAIRILKPVHARTAPATSRQPGRGLVDHQVIGFGVGAVFDVTQTVGPPIWLPRPPVAADRSVAKGVWAAVVREAAADGFTVDVRPTGDVYEGLTDHAAKRIVIADHLDDFRAVARLVHELAHVRLHSPAALREGLGLVGDAEDRGAEMCGGIREVEAESVAYVVLAHHGLPAGAGSFEYLAEWARRVDPKEPASAIKATGARVVNVARRLIDSTDRYLKNDRTTLCPVPARPLDSAFLMPDLDGPAR